MGAGCTRRSGPMGASHPRAPRIDRPDAPAIWLKKIVRCASPWACGALTLTACRLQESVHGSGALVLNTKRLLAKILRRTR